MSAGRFVIEGTWLGYRSSQDRIVHRTVHKASEKRLRAWAEKTHSVTYTDGTRLLIDVRDCKPRERVEEKPEYSSLIRDCVYYDANTVQDVINAQEAAKAAQEPSMNTVKHMRRLNDFKPVHAVVAMLADMPMPSDAEINSIVAALKERIKANSRLRYVALALADVQDAIDDADTEPPDIVIDLSCDGCGGSGVNRHNGGGCIGCGGRGVAA